MIFFEFDNDEEKTDAEKPVWAEEGGQWEHTEGSSSRNSRLGPPDTGFASRFGVLILGRAGTV